MITHLQWIDYEERMMAAEKKLSEALQVIGALVEVSECRNDEDCDHCEAVRFLKAP